MLGSVGKILRLNFEPVPTNIFIASKSSSTLPEFVYATLVSKSSITAPNLFFLTLSLCLSIIWGWWGWHNIFSSSIVIYQLSPLYSLLFYSRHLSRNPSIFPLVYLYFYIRPKSYIILWTHTHSLFSSHDIIQRITAPLTIIIIKIVIGLNWTGKLTQRYLISNSIIRFGIWN